jgi:hypothetical protein
LDLKKPLYRQYPNLAIGTSMKLVFLIRDTAAGKMTVGQELREY